jgi:DNA polymerase I-like protein with 3'-5' exonuclease and polymerase domains
MTLAAVKKMKEDLFEEYPEFAIMGQQAEDKVARWRGGQGYLTMLDGWRRWYQPSEKTNSAVNQVIQCNLARAMNKWGLAIEREVPGCLLLQVHDSLVTRHHKSEEGYQEALKVSAIGRREIEKYFSVRGRVMSFPICPERWNEKS